jgi:hypothetical protein
MSKGLLPTEKERHLYHMGAPWESVVENLFKTIPNCRETRSNLSETSINEQFFPVT